MKKGALIGAVAALFVYAMLPIYVDEGVPAKILPTGNAVSSSTGFYSYMTHLPSSMVIFFALEILGISLGAASQLFLSESKQKDVAIIPNKNKIAKKNKKK